MFGESRLPYTKLNAGNAAPATPGKPGKPLTAEVFVASGP